MSVKKQSQRPAAKKSVAKRMAEPAAALPKRVAGGRQGKPAKVHADSKRSKTALKLPHAAAAAVKKKSRASAAAKSSTVTKNSKAAALKAPAKVPLKSKAADKAKAPAAALPAAKEPAKKTAAGKLLKPTTLEDLKAMQTEDVWVLYRKARKANDDPVWLELLRNALMELHYPLVRHIAERLLQTLPKSIELDDLISAGVFGLMDAIRGFDPDRGIKFKTYCTTRIRGSILDQLRSQDWVPRLVRLKAGRIDKAFQKLRGEYGREPTHAELATCLKLNHEELITEIDESRARTMNSINERWNEHDDDSSMEKIDIVEDTTSVDPIKEMNKRDMLKYITRSLTHKEQFIIEQYYQIGHTMREIGEMLALTESRVCQIHSNVMSRLKALLGPQSPG